MPNPSSPESAKRQTPIVGLRPVTIRPVKDPPSADVARVLLDYILSGHVGPGEKLPSERQLSESLGVGRAVVREGMKSLGLLGLVEFRHGGGTYLRTSESELLPKVIEWGLLLGEQRVVDLIEARRHLEILIAQLAAERRNDQQLAAIEGAMEAMTAAQSTGEYVDADLAFHQAIAAASNNSVLMNMHGSISSLLRVWIQRNTDAAESFEPSLKEHLPVLQAIRARDSQRAASTAKKHMDAASKRLVATITAATSSAP